MFNTVQSYFLCCMDIHLSGHIVNILGMCGMDFSSSVRFRFGFDKNRGFGSVSVSVRF